MEIKRQFEADFGTVDCVHDSDTVVVISAHERDSQYKRVRLSVEHARWLAKWILDCCEKAESMSEPSALIGA